MRIVVLFLFVFGASAETIWVAQTTQGGDTGVDAANAHSAAWFNTVGNWGAGAGKVSAGDTVMITGTITTALSVQGSGSAGSPITIQFAPGAKLSSGSWNTTGALSGSGKNFIVVSGAAIESTDNGSGLGNTNDDRHIAISSCNDWTISGLISSNTYVTVSGNSNAFGESIYTLRCSDLVVTNCRCSQGGKIILISFDVGTSNVTVINNIITNVIVGCTVGSVGAGATLDGLTISGNMIGIGTNWSGDWLGGTAWHHTDCVHTYAGHTGSWISNEVVSANYFGKYNSTFTSGGTTTAWLYIESVGTNFYPLVYNNVFEIGTGANQGPSVALLDFKGNAINPKIFNNTFYGVGAREGLYFDLAVQPTVYNNIFYGLNLPSWQDTASPSAVFDYNDYFLNDNVGRLTSTYYVTLPNWRTGLGGCPGSGKDCNGIATDPSLSSGLTLGTNSPCINTATNLSAYFTTDKAGNPRGSLWDIGAFEFISTPPTTMNTVRANIGRITAAP